MSLRYAIDAVHAFKGLYFLEGWAYDRSRAVKPKLKIGTRPIRCDIEICDRPDLKALFPEIDQPVGFRVRAVLPRGADAALIRLKLLNVHIDNPGAELSARTTGVAMQRLNDAFFEHVKPGRVLEIGSRNRSGIVRRSQFAGMDYTGLDVAPGENVDVVGDAHDLSSLFPAENFDLVYSVSVFEHMMWPWKAVLELNTILKAGGLVFTQSHQTWPKHEEPWDFFRFSTSAWRGLFCDATGFRIVDTADTLPGHIVPAHFHGEASQRLDDQPAMLLSACVAQKVGAPKVSWTAAPDYEGIGTYPV